MLSLPSSHVFHHINVSSYSCHFKNTHSVAISYYCYWMRKDGKGWVADSPCSGNIAAPETFSNFLALRSYILVAIASENRRSSNFCHWCDIHLRAFQCLAFSVWFLTKNAHWFYPNARETKLICTQNRRKFWVWSIFMDVQHLYHK